MSVSRSQTVNFFLFDFDVKSLDLPFIVFFEIPIDDLIENLWRCRIDSWAQSLVL